MDLSAGTPQPLLERSTAGPSPLNHSKSFQAASGTLLLADMTIPVAVIVGSSRWPAHIGAGSMTTCPLVTSLSAIALNQKPYWIRPTVPLVKSSPIQLGLGVNGLAIRCSLARSKKYFAATLASPLPVRSSLVKLSV